MTESPKFYFKQFFFCCVGLSIAIWLDNNFADDLLDLLSLGSLDDSSKGVVKLLVFPGVLLIMAQLHKLYEAARASEHENLSSIAKKRAAAGRK